MGPDDQVTLPVPQVPYDHPHPRGGQPVLTIPTNWMGALPRQVDAACVWCASSTGMTPVTGQILLAGRGYRTLV